MCIKSKQTSGLSRRDLLQTAGQYSALAGAASLIGSRAFALPNTVSSERGPTDPHYFLHINIPLGVDASYLFDARPLSMTKDGLIANYHGKEPILYTGINGETTLRTTLTEPLMKWKDRFSVINGVVMSHNLVAHEQLMNVLLTGNPFGGDSFLPWTSPTKMPLDYLLSSGFFLAQLTNGEASMQLTPEACRELAKKLNRIGTNQTITSHIQSRSNQVGAGKTSLAAASRRLASSMGAMSDLTAKISTLQIPAEDTTAGQDPTQKLLKQTHANIAMLSEFMRTGLTNTGVLILDDNIDSHDAKTASELPTKLGAFYQAIAAVFEYLNTVQSPSGRSMLDDTTFLIGSEFSRTMRYPGQPIDKTGTDHNPLTNTLIVGGKGVRGGMILGQSDFASSTEILSPAHLSSDPARIMIMGRPFDHGTGRTITDTLPQAYDPTIYLGASNVTNTLQDIFGIPAAKRFTYGRNMPVATSIKSLIA